MSAAGGDGTLDRLIRILGAFEAGRPALTVAALARRAELPLATAYRWVERLVAAELLQRDDDGLVRPGLRLWEIASRGAPGMSLVQTATPFLVDVQAVLKQHTQLAVLDDEGVLVLARLSSPGAVVNQATVAGRLPTFTTSLGLVLLAHAPTGIAEEFIARHHERLGDVAAPGTPVADAAGRAGVRARVSAPTGQRLRAVLADARREGYAAVDGALDEEARGIAVPVLGADGAVVAALGVVVPGDAPYTPGVPSLLMTAARGITRGLGGHSH